jgi:hypothetical protein
LRLLFLQEAGAAGNKDEGRRQRVSDRAPVDDQPLMPHDD